MFIPNDRVPAVVDFGALARDCKAAGASVTSRGPHRLPDGSLDPTVTYEITGVSDDAALALMDNHDGQPLQPEPVPIVIVEDAGELYAETSDGKRRKLTADAPVSRVR